MTYKQPEACSQLPAGERPAYVTKNQRICKLAYLLGEVTHLEQALGFLGAGEQRLGDEGCVAVRSHPDRLPLSQRHLVGGGRTLALCIAHSLQQLRPAHASLPIHCTVETKPVLRFYPFDVMMTMQFHRSPCTKTSTVGIKSVVSVPLTC